MKLFFKVHFPRLYRALKKVYRKIVPVPANTEAALKAPDTETLAAGKNEIVESLVEWSRLQNRLLIVGRIKQGDSIAMFTTAFLNSVDYQAYDVFLYEEYTHALYLYKDRETAEFVKYCYAPELDPSFFDMLLFVNVLDNCEPEYPFRLRVPSKPPFLSWAYPVFDGTEPPVEWINAINEYFDAVITPCKNLKGIFERSGVMKPVFELPIALDIRAFACQSGMPHNRAEYVFGWIGTFEDRKNPLKIIRAFRNAFGNSGDVRLLMHTRYIDKTTETGKRFEAIRAELPANITISEGVRSEDDIITLMNGFDTYVYVSQGEGYSNSPRQAMGCGLSLILSAIPTHRNITELDEAAGVFWVPATREIDAVQPSLNNRVCGKMFDIETEELTKTFRYVYEHRDAVNSVKNVVRRKKYAERYDIDNLSYLYRQLILPNAIRPAQDNRICEDAMETADPDLLAKYRHYLRREHRDIIVCPAHDGGFCSVFNKWMAHLVYAPENTILIPDWRVKRLRASVLSQFGRREFTSFCYGTEADGNIFFRIFANPYKGLLSDELLETNLMYEAADRVLEVLDFNAEHEPNLTYINSYNLYADDEYFPMFRRKYNHYYRKYIKLVPELQAKIDQFAEEHLNGKFVISAHIRSAAHQSELIEGDKPTWELYEKHIRAILEKEYIPVESDGWRLFIASDNSQSIAHFTEIFGSHVVSQPMNRLNEEDDRVYQEAAKKAGKNIEGFGLQHKAAHDENKWSLQNAYEILFDVHMLARGDYYIFVNSNISTMVSYVNPDTKMIYCR